MGIEPVPYPSRSRYFTKTIVSGYVSVRDSKMKEPKNGFRWRYEQNQLFKFVKNTIRAIAKC